jgi:thiamine kinase-like enzyme
MTPDPSYPAPSEAVSARAARLLGWTPTAWRFVAGGYTPAARYIASAGGERAFVKVATTALSADQLRREGFVYEHLHGPFMPGFTGWDDDAREPLLVIEDLSLARWPPPWDPRAVDLVLEQLAAIHSTTAKLPRFSEAHGSLSGGWAAVAANPGPFLSLGLASQTWLVRALPRLIQAEADCPTEGEAVSHCDLRSDNICLTAAGAKLVDWPGACLGNPELDLGSWLPSLCFEGGPAPEELLPNAPQVAAWVCGYFAARAGLPFIPDAPFVRRVQREQLTTALPWVARALRLGDP